MLTELSSLYYNNLMSCWESKV